MHFNWTWRNAPRIASFLLRDGVARRLDRRFGRQSREAKLLEFVVAHAQRGDPADVHRVMDEFARTQRWLMNVGPVKGKVLRDALDQAAAKRVLEIGAYCGYSAVLIGAAVAPRGGQLVSIEASRRFAEVARGVVAHAGLTGTVDVQTGTLTTRIDALREPFDLVFLDHWKDEYLPDLQRLERAGLLRPGTVVVADNIRFFAVPEYLDYVRNGGRYDSRYVAASVEYHPELEDGVEVSTFRG
jgi:catechol O-methyltransferase